MQPESYSTMLKTRPLSQWSEPSEAPRTDAGAALDQWWAHLATGIPSHASLLPSTLPDLAFGTGNFVVLVEAKGRLPPKWAPRRENAIHGFAACGRAHNPPLHEGGTTITGGGWSFFEAGLQEQSVELRFDVGLPVEDDVVLESRLPTHRVTLKVRRRRRPSPTLSLSEGEWHRLLD